ncbi:MAG: flagellar hook-length control protein FliK [Stellaceae bacterium]
MPDPSPSNLAGQLSGPIMGAVANGHRDLSLHLHPPELGEVSVRLVVSGRTVSAWFDSPQPQVQQAIGQGIGELRADLAAAGYDLSGAWVGGQAWTPRERGGSPPAPRPVRPAAAGAPVPEVRGTAPAAAGAGVSVYV